MSEILSFPGLGLQFEINRIAFMVGAKPIYWYGIIVALAFLAAAAYALLRSRTFGLDSDRVIDVVLCAVVFGIIGARLYYVIFEWSTYADNLLSIFYVWEGGIAIYGGIIGGVAAAAFACRWRRVKLLPMFDLAAGSLLLGQAIGRWGNFVNMEAFGSNTDVIWGMSSPTISRYLEQNASNLAQMGISVSPDAPVHPTFFYESMWCVLGFAFICWFTSRRRFDGELFLIYLGWYGLGRFFIEGLRTDSLMLGTMRVSQIVALSCVIASSFALITMLSKVRRANDPEYLMLYVDTDEGKSVLAGTFYKIPDNTGPERHEDEAESEKDAGLPAETGAEENPGLEAGTEPGLETAGKPGLEVVEEGASKPEPAASEPEDKPE